MRSNPARKTPFNEGRASVKSNVAAKNPYDAASVEYRNYELGRAFGLRHLGGVIAPRMVTPRA